VTQKQLENGNIIRHHARKTDSAAALKRQTTTAFGILSVFLARDVTKSRQTTVTMFTARAAIILTLVE
jgi:hypothetical protein